MRRALAALLLAASAAWAAIDLREAAVVTPASLSRQERKAVQMLVEEVEKRSHVRWPVLTTWPAGKPAIGVATAAAIASLGTPLAREMGAGGGPEGFRLRAWEAERTILVAGHDRRGVLFGIGRLLRELRMERGTVELPEALDLATAPKYPIRGHQMGNRPLNNAVDAWTAEQWEQGIRDLAVFGANAIEFIPPGATEEATSPHDRLPPLEMMARVSQLLDDYGLDVWLWHPANEKDYTDPATLQRARAGWGAVFRRLPRLDAVFVPGGDPGHTHPKILLPFLAGQAEILRQFHPRAGLWLSPQGFDDSWMGDLYAALRAEPAWLAGLVYGPGVRVSVEELRRQTPARYPIRLYPDITHTVRAQYPVPGWDPIFSMTEGREPINPRPLAQARILRETIAPSAGFITYSDGVNDDVNKAVWSALGWDPDTPVDAILRDYGRYFLGERYGDDFRQATLALERNWDGPLALNGGITATLGQWQALERTASPPVRANWRFQMGLFRAYLDAYIQRRYLRETAAVERARAWLARAPAVGSRVAVGEAAAALDEVAIRPPAADWRARLEELGAALYQSIGLQLSQRYGGFRRDRATSLDTMDDPITMRPWWLRRLREIGELAEEAQRLGQIEELLGWDDPGPGGFYDDLGNPLRQPRLLRSGEEFPTSSSAFPDGPITWSWYGTSGIGRPLRLRYAGLDPEARYRVRVVYAGENVSQDQGIRLMADEWTVHPYIKKPLPVRPVEFDVPWEATRDGEMVLSFDREVAPSGRIRGAQVAEVWLLRKK